MSTVEAKHVWKIYEGNVEAVRDANFFCDQEQFVAILGPSGCGKSSLLKNLLGLVEALGRDLVLEALAKRRDPGPEEVGSLGGQASQPLGADAAVPQHDAVQRGQREQRLDAGIRQPRPRQDELLQRRVPAQGRERCIVDVAADDFGRVSPFAQSATDCVEEPPVATRRIQHAGCASAEGTIILQQRVQRSAHDVTDKRFGRIVDPVGFSPVHAGHPAAGDPVAQQQSQSVAKLLP